MDNTLFPGRPLYRGPREGIFGLIHHDTLFETSHNISERVSYVKRNKPAEEVPIRLKNMIYLGELRESNEYFYLWDNLSDEYKIEKRRYLANRKSSGNTNKITDDLCVIFDGLFDKYAARKKYIYGLIISYIKSHMPECSAEWKSVGFPSLLGL